MTVRPTSCRYGNGGEGLYDDECDPHERTTLATDPGHKAVTARVARHLPAHDARDVAEVGAAWDLSHWQDEAFRSTGWAATDAEPA